MSLFAHKDVSGTKVLDKSRSAVLNEGHKWEMVIVGSLINSTAFLFYSVRLCPFGPTGKILKKQGKLMLMAYDYYIHILV